MNLRTVLFVLGILLSILGIAMLLPAIFQFYIGENSENFLTSSFITIFVGVLLILSNLYSEKRLNLQEAFILTTASWVGIALFGSFPFFFSDLELSFSDSLFESMSGITTTGSTVIANLDIAPKGILMWRALLQWLGGIGIIVMAITILPFLGVGGMQLFQIQSASASEKILPKTKEISFKIFYIYFSLTFFCFISYYFAGMNIFDSLAHSMTTIATGGFSTHTESIGFFKNPIIEIVSIIFIIMGSLPFIAYLKFIRGEKKIFFSDLQIRGFLFLILVSIIVMFFYLLINHDLGLLENLRIASFNVISILSGTGYVTSDFSVWGNFPLIFFLFLMFIGGCAGSTACGIKIFRIQILLSFFKTQIKKILYPNGIFPIRYNKNKINPSFISSVITFIYLYFLIFFVIIILLTLNGMDFVSAISGAASAISNVGPGLGEKIGPSGNFKDLSNISKWILSFGMLLGRLEMIAVLVLFVPKFWKN